MRGRTTQALTFFLRPIVRFTRFNRIEIWSLHVNANRYIFRMNYMSVSFDRAKLFSAKLINISQTSNTCHNNLQAVAAKLTSQCIKNRYTEIFLHHLSLYI